MKPVNWISATGFSPCAAMPTLTPAISASASGVSSTRPAPKRFCSSTVARNTPPFAPTSSPSTTTSASRAISCASAMLIACTMLTSAMAALLRRGRALRLQRSRQLREQVIEHRFRRRLRDREVGIHRLLHAFGAFRVQRLLLVLAPRTLFDEMIAQTADRLVRPALLHFLRVAVAARVVRGGVVAE